MKLILKSVIGSRAHGLSREGSDVDFYSVYSGDVDDPCLISKEKFIRHVKEGEPQALDALWVTPQYTSAEGKKLRSNRHEWLTPQIIHGCLRTIDPLHFKTREHRKNSSTTRYHCLRILITVCKALDTGEWDPDVSEYRDLLLSIREGQVSPDDYNQMYIRARTWLVESVLSGKNNVDG